MGNFQLLLIAASLASAYGDQLLDINQLLRPDIFGSAEEPQQPKIYQLCLYDSDSYNKCLHLVDVAEKSSIDLPLKCVQQENRSSCASAVAAGEADLLVVTAHGYLDARGAGLQPIIYERDSNESLHIAVAPKNIGVVDVSTAQIEVDQKNYRAFHAAAYFNLRRGHDICSMHSTQSSNDATIKIVDAAEYTPKDDEILFCPDRSYANGGDYQRCNFEATLQRAIFVSGPSSTKLAFDLKLIVSRILTSFGPEAKNADNFNFFSTFNGKDNVIFKNNAVAFDFNPTYLNGVSEAVYHKLHCNTDEQDHDSRQLD